MRKQFLTLLILSLLFSSAFTSDNNFSKKRRFLQDVDELASASDIEENHEETHEETHEENQEEDQEENATKPCKMMDSEKNIEEEKNNQNAADYKSTDSNQFITIFGRASGKVSQEKAVIGFTIETVDHNPSFAIQNNVFILNSALDDLKNLGLKDQDFEKTHKQIYQIEVQNADDSECTILFRAVLSFTITANSELVGEILEKAAENGIKKMDYATYLSSIEDIETLNKNLLKQAIKNSKNRARLVIEELGYELGPVMDIKVLNKDEFDFNRINELLKSNEKLPEFEQLVEVKYGMRMKSEKPEDESSEGKNENSEGENTQGENSEGENTSGEGSEAENTEGENTQQQGTEGESSEGESTEGVSTEGQNCNHIEGENTEGEITEGENTEGESTEGESAEGESTEGESTEGESTEGESLEGESTEGESAEGESAEGESAEGESAEGESAEGESAEGENTEGENVEGEYPEGENCDNSEGENTEAENTEENTEGENAVGDDTLGGEEQP